MKNSIKSKILKGGGIDRSPGGQFAEIKLCDAHRHYDGSMTPDEGDVYNMYLEAKTHEEFKAADTKYDRLKDIAGDKCKPAHVKSILSRYKQAMRAELARDPEANIEALTEEQKLRFEKLKQELPLLQEQLSAINIKKQETDAAVAKAKEQNVVLQAELTEANESKQRLMTNLAKNSSFNVEKKSSQNPWKGYQKTVFRVVKDADGKPPKLEWESRTNKNTKDILINTISNIKMNINMKGQNDKGEDVTLDLKSIDSSPNDLFFLYAHASGLLPTAPQADKEAESQSASSSGAAGGKKLSHYKKTKNKKFNSKHRLTCKSKTKKTKKRK